MPQGSTYTPLYQRQWHHHPDLPFRYRRTLVQRRGSQSAERVLLLPGRAFARFTRQQRHRVLPDRRPGQPGLLVHQCRWRGHHEEQPTLRAVWQHPLQRGQSQHCQWSWNDLKQHAKPEEFLIARRGYGKGSTYLRGDGRWAGSILLEDGKRVRGTSGGGGIRTHEGYSPYTISSRAH